MLSSAGVSATVEDSPSLGISLRVEPSAAKGAVAALKESDHAFNFMVDLFGIDTGEQVDVVYHLRSLSRDEEVRVRAHVAYGGTVASIWELFPAALMPERELAEQFGLKLSGHINPKHLLLTDKVPPLLLKSTRIRTAEEVRNR